MINPISSIHKWYLDYQTTHILSKQAGTIDVPKKMLNEIYTWILPLREKMAAAYHKGYADRQLANLDRAFKITSGGGLGSIQDFAKNLKINISKFNLEKEMNFFHGIDEQKEGKTERKSPGFFDKLKDGSLLADARDYSGPRDDYKSLNIDINNMNIDFRLRTEGDTIKGVPYHCWPVIYKVRGYGQSLYVDEDDCDQDLMYEILEFSFNRPTGKLEVDIFDEPFLRNEMRRFKEWVDIIVAYAKENRIDKDFPDGFEFIFERPKLIRKEARGWLIRNNIQFYQNYLTTISIMISSLENYLRSAQYKGQEEIIDAQSVEAKNFKTDVSDTKQYQEFKKEIDELLAENIFSHLKVILEVGEERRAWFDTTGAASHGLPQIYVLEDANDLRSKNSLIQTLSHELVHFMQDLLTYAVKRRNKYLQDKKWRAGMPGKYDPESYMFYTPNYEKDPEYQKQHALSDVEFYTRLEDSLGNMRNFVRRPTITDDDLAFIQEIQPKGIIENNIYKMPRTNRMKVMKDRFERYLADDDTLKYLRRYDISNFNKMIRELYRNFDDITKTASISKRAGKKNSAGIFAVVPGDLAKGFPSLGEHDKSKPHITVLYIGKVPKKHENLLEEIIKKVTKEYKPFKVELDDKVSYFPASKHSDGCKIAKLKIISKDLHKLHNKLKKAISDAGIEIDDHFPDYKPHVTLEYMEPGKEKYDGDFPKGSWIVESVEIWNDEHKKRFRLGGKNISKLAAEKVWQSINDWDSDVLYRVLDTNEIEEYKTTPTEVLKPGLTEERAIEQIKKDPVVFLSYSSFSQKFPHLERMAMEEVARRYPETYFLGRYYESKYQDLNEIAFTNLLASKPSLYFTMGLFNHKKLADKIVEVMNAVVQKEPNFFLDVLLPLEKFKDFKYLEDIAKNIIRKKAYLSKKAGEHITSADLNKIYELEYKLFKLNQRPQLSDKAYLLKNKWLTELYNILTKVFNVLINVYEEWIEAEMYIMSNSHPKYVIDREIYNNIFKNTPMDKIDDALELTKKEFIQKIWAEEDPYKGIQKIYNELKYHKINPNDINRSIVLFHLALNTAHFGGLMVEHLARYVSNTTPSKVLRMLDQLSAVKDIEEWNMELAKIAKDKLKKYKEKRKFEKTPEPKGKISKRDAKKFVIHNHKATKHHWDLRLEHKGVLESWALPKHRLPKGKERLLAVQTEPHPLSYAKFEGKIPEGEYGAGMSTIHDSGKYELIKWEKDTIKFKLNGKKEKGAYTLHKTDRKNWMIMRMKDEINKEAGRSPWEIKLDIKYLADAIKEIQQTNPEEGAGYIKMYEENIQELNEELKEAKDTPENLKLYREFLEQEDAIKKHTEMLIDRMKREFAVLLDEEFGYRYWVWFPKMTSKELEFWWRSLSSVEPYFFSPKGLPGEVVQVKEENIWPDLIRSKKFYLAHMHDDQDSFLRRPDGTEIERKVRQ